MRTKNEKMVRTLLPVAAGAACMIFLLAAMNGIVELQDATPRIGDIIAFTPSRQQAVDGGLRLIAQRLDQFGCILDLNILQHSGGSLVVESQVLEAKGMFRVHWAGGRTTADSGNCGEDADLILNAHEMDVLASAADAYDPLQKRDPVFTK